jgi:hypothetical protein
MKKPLEELGLGPSWGGKKALALNALIRDYNERRGVRACDEHDDCIVNFPTAERRVRSLEVHVSKTLPAPLRGEVHDDFICGDYNALGPMPCAASCPCKCHKPERDETCSEFLINNGYCLHAPKKYPGLSLGGVRLARSPSPKEEIVAELGRLRVKVDHKFWDDIGHILRKVRAFPDHNA